MSKQNLLYRLSVKVMWLLMSMMIVLAVSCRKKTVVLEMPPTPEPPQEEVTTGFVYASNHSSKFEIYKAEEQEYTQLTDDLNLDCWWPRVSPDGTKILFYKSKAGRETNDFADAELWIMDIDGGNQLPLINRGQYNWDMQGLANWSPDGTQLIMGAVVDSIGTWQLFLTDAEGNNPTRISNRAEADYLDPVFSEDGESIFCSTTPPGETGESNHEIYELFIGSNEELRLTNDDKSDHHPAVSPDGVTILYETLEDASYLSIGKWTLRSIDLSTSSNEEVLNDDDINLFPRFSKSGDYVYYTRLDVETFLMTVYQLDLVSGSSSSAVPSEGSSLTPDPY